MMRCHDDLIQLYVDGDLQPVEAALVEEHLQGCDSCRRRAAFYKGLFWDLAHGERLAPAPEADAESLATLLRAEWERGRSEARPASGLELSTLWLTGNPLVAGTARATGTGLSRAGAELTRLAGTGISKLLRRKGGGRR
ncbi:MAG: anti-sigma factor family protein [Bacillota bacterium]